MKAEFWKKNISLIAQPRIWQTAAFGLLSLAAATGLATFSKGLATTHLAEVVVDAKIDGNGTFQVFINNDFSNPYQLPVLPNARQEYRFGGIFLPGNITQLRFDPINASGVRFQFFGIKIRKNGETLTIPPSELRTWDSLNVLPQGEPSRPDFEAVSSSDDPILAARQPPAFTTPEAAFPPPPWLIRNFGLNLCVGSAILVALLSLSLRPLLAALILPLAAAAFSSLWLIRKALVVFPGSSFPVQEAVGYSNLIGYPKTGEFFAFFLGFTACLALGAAIGFLVRRKAAPAESRERRFSWIFLFVGTLVFAAFTFPPLLHMHNALSAAIHNLDYDSMNMITWEYFAQKGLLPHRDFWYPYFGQYNESGPYPIQAFRVYLRSILLFLVFFTSAYLLLRKSVTRTLLLLAAVGALILSDLINSTGRYFHALNVTLFFVAIQRVRSTFKSLVAYLVFGLLMGWTFIFEPNQLIYALVPVFCLTLLYLVHPATHRTQLLRGLGLGLGILAAWAALYLSFLQSRGQLAGFVDFFATANGMSVYAALPVDLRNWLRLAPVTEHLLVQLVLLSGLAGAFLCAFAPRLTQGGDVLLATALLSAVVFQKQLIRPHAALQFFAYVIVGWLIVLGMGTLHWNRLRIRIGLIILGLLFIYSFNVGWTHEIGRNLADKLVMAPTQATVLFRNSEELKQRVLSYFAPDTFRSQGLKGEEYLSRLKQLAPDGKIPLVYVLGDDSFFYIILQQATPRYITFYNGAHVVAQEETLQWLRAKAPDWVIWNPEFRAFDQVQNQVRVPLIFRHIVQNYEAFAKIGKYELLKRKPAQRPIDFGYWAKNLGSSLDLGHIPGLSAAGTLPDCPPASTPECIHFLELKAPAAGKHSSALPLELRFQGQDGEYKVLFTASGKKDLYYIRLDRLWFLDDAQSTAGGWEKIAGALPAGWSLRDTWKTSSRPMLY